MHRVPSQANQLPTATTHDPRPAQPRVGGSCSKISFPTNNAHQRRTQLSKRRQPHAHTHRGEAPPINQPVNHQPQTIPAAPSAENKESPRRTPPILHPGHLPESSASAAAAAASAPCTRPQIFNQRPDRFTAVYYDQQPSTRTRRTRWWPFRLNIRRRKHCCRSTSVLLLLTSLTPTDPPTPRLSQWGRRAKKSIGYTHSQPAKSHPTNVPPPGNRPTTTNRPDRSTDTTQKEEQNNSYNVPSARTRAEQHK